MNLDTVRPKNETEDLLFQITEHCETLVKQTHTKPQATIEFKLNKSRETFSFKSPISIERFWRIGLTSLNVCKSIFHITEENNKFNLYTDTFDESSYRELKDELEENLEIPNFSRKHLQDKKRPRKVKAFEKLETEKRGIDGYYMFLMVYARSPFRDFDSYLRIVVGLDEDDIRLILKQYNSNSVTYEISPGIYSIEIFLEVVYTMRDHEGTLQSKYDDRSMETKPILTQFGGKFGTLKFDEKYFFKTILGFTSYCDYKHNNAFHAGSPSVYTIEKTLNFSTIEKIRSKCDVIDGSVVKRIREPILFIFNLDKLSGYKIFCEPETFHCKERNKSVLNTITFYIENDNQEEVNFNGKTLTFTLQMIKI